MANRAEAEVDLAAIMANIHLLQKHTGVGVMAVVKADAYGHGLLPTANAAVAAGAAWLGVALLEEALALRNAEISIPILAWLVPLGSDYASAIIGDIDFWQAMRAAPDRFAGAVCHSLIRHGVTLTGRPGAGFPAVLE